MATLSIRPTTLRAANAYVAEHHSHHGPVRGLKFAVECVDGARVVGVAIVGRPVARKLDDGVTFEITRVCTDRTVHVASKLVAACTRAAFAMGYRRGVSYTLAAELGTSYLAAGWTRVADSNGGTWNRAARPRTEPLAFALGLPPKHPEGPKVRWERLACL